MKEDILQKLDAVCKALNSIGVVGINNAANLAGSYNVLQEIIADIQNFDFSKKEK